ncbi:MAG: hypothetical protein OQK25_03850 [Gammaproteobacteria bacterium]|nr:hypothetical protein [Gammaproteobacteria bacterium]MCW8982469.1 hypothetical protein [Gammaproteobacteria bacterium]
MSIERVCEYNGQTVTLHPETLTPMTDHDCGHDDCPLVKVIRSEKVRELNFEKEDWAGVCEWSELFDE